MRRSDSALFQNGGQIVTDFDTTRFPSSERPCELVDGTGLNTTLVEGSEPGFVLDRLDPFADCVRHLSQSDFEWIQDRVLAGEDCALTLALPSAFLPALL